MAQPNIKSYIPTTTPEFIAIEMGINNMSILNLNERDRNEREGNENRMYMNTGNISRMNNNIIVETKKPVITLNDISDEINNYITTEFKDYNLPLPVTIKEKSTTTKITNLVKKGFSNISETISEGLNSIHSPK
jgi:hypothetical protein